MSTHASAYAECVSNILFHCTAQSTLFVFFFHEIHKAFSFRFNLKNELFLCDRMSKYQSAGTQCKVISVLPCHIFLHSSKRIAGTAIPAAAFCITDSAILNVIYAAMLASQTLPCLVSQTIPYLVSSSIGSPAFASCTLI